MARLIPAALLVTGLALSACSRKEERVLFDGNYYPTKARAADKADRKTFTVSVRRASRGLNGAKAAGAHAGKQYCLENFGTSEINWRVGPDAPEGTFDRSASSIALSGTCVLW
jgi:hypothetical protein